VVLLLLVLLLLLPRLLQLLMTCKLWSQHCLQV
jgi:hypothetical protein